MKYILFIINNLLHIYIYICIYFGLYNFYNYIYQSELFFSNIKYNSNNNSNKYHCGNIHVCNDVEVSIFSSEFSNNISKSNGGVM